MSRYKIAMAQLFFMICTSCLAGAEVIDKIVVVVNEEVITQRELDRRVEPLLQSYRISPEDPGFSQVLKETRSKVLEQLIDDRVLYSEAKRTKIDVAEEDVKGQLDTVKKQFNSDAEFEEALKQQSLNLNELKENYRQNLIVKKLIDMQVSAKITVNPAEVKEYYEKNIKEFTVPKMAKVRSIVIKTKKDRDEAQALKLAEEIQKAIKAGQSFAELAEKYSDSFYASKGGDMGFVKEGEMKDNIDKVIFSLKPGQTSDIIKTDMGLHIFKVEEVKGQETRDLDTVSDQIEQEIYKLKFKDKLSAYLNRLRESAYIEFK